MWSLKSREAELRNVAAARRGAGRRERVHISGAVSCSAGTLGWISSYSECCRGLEPCGGNLLTRDGARLS